MLTVKQAAERLGLKKRSVNSMIERGELQTAGQFAGAFMIEESEVERVIAERQAAADEYIEETIVIRKKPKGRPRRLPPKKED